jgi:glycosyltransferase involved in cell wall biosynthesis
VTTHPAYRLPLPPQTPAATPHPPASTAGTASTARAGSDPSGKDPRPVNAGGAVARDERGGPLVTCIMPTCDRLAFARNSVRLFEAQDYPRRELVVVDDSADGRLESSLPADPRIRYLPARPGESIGVKRNRACAAAAGEYIAHWDDDDWYGPRRLSAQLEPLVAGRADLSALLTPVFFDLAAWQFWRVSPQLHRRLFVEDVHGGTLVYRRAVWERFARYPDASLAEDAQFLLAATRRGGRLARIPGEGLFVYVRHGRNAWRFTCGEQGGADGWVRGVEPPLPPEDRAFYVACHEAEVRSRSKDRSHVGHGRAGRHARGLGSVFGDSASPGPPWDGRFARRRDGGPAPLVSCIMPTMDRRRFVSRAIAYFSRQDYPRRELLVLDDGEDAVDDLVPADPLIRYVRLERRLVLGEKRNLACELARGSVIVHWDDDDWQAPNRISYQVEQLRLRGADLCGTRRLLYLEPARRRAWLYDYPATAPGLWVAGNGLCYRIEAWRERPFANVAVGEDSRFIHDRGREALAVLDDHRFVIGLLHEANSNRKPTSSTGWRRRPLDEVRALMGRDYGTYAAQPLGSVTARRPAVAVSPRPA